ncbi:MAG: imidazole glycerol phosphate synthase subunit HisH [Gemmatimonadales bacterium]|nr:imidazole glycerol phosphate synthase subunit HisH [Gemmatimonadales bacterium]
MIVVVDYGVNNLRSVVRALQAGGHAPVLSDDPDTVRGADHVLVPGVGNYGRAARTLAESGLGDAISDVARAGRPLMGICLGMQLFFRSSEEAEGAAGLGLLEGRVRRFGSALPVPHVGWAEVVPTGDGSAHRMLAAVFQAGPQFFYHVHSFHPTDLPDGSTLATGEYGGPFPTLVGRDNIVGAQFHPEKSQRAGIGLLDAFARWRP